MEIIPILESETARARTKIVESFRALTQVLTHRHKEVISRLDAWIRAIVREEIEKSKKGIHG